MTEVAKSVPELLKQACEDCWDAHKSNCSGFVKAVAAKMGISLRGQANDIIEHISSNWTKAADGADAAAKAGEGKFVVGGLKATPNGHVVVVVSGPLNRGKYPTAYWGRLGGVGQKKKTVNFSWNGTDRDKVEYYYVTIDGTAVAGAAPMRIIGWTLQDAMRQLRA